MLGEGDDAKLANFCPTNTEEGHGSTEAFLLTKSVGTDKNYIALETFLGEASDVYAFGMVRTLSV